MALVPGRKGAFLLPVPPMSRAAGRPGPGISPQQSRMKMRSTALCAVLLSMAAPALQGCGGLPPGEETNEAAEEAADALLTPAPDLPKPWVDAIDLSEQTELLDFQYVIPPEEIGRASSRERVCQYV